jgi:TolB-like protein/DNA-binding winged helix-turn-helix (wHTH) protein
MDALARERIYLSEGFCLDLQTGGLFRTDKDGVLVRLAIGSRALDILALLVTRHGEVVSKDEIMSTVWPGTVVEDSNLPTQILALRRVLDRDRAQGSCIQTVSGRGYRFVAAVSRSSVQDRSGVAVISDPAHPAGGAQRCIAPTRMSGAGGRSGPWRHLLGSVLPPAVIGGRRRLDPTCAPHLSLVVLPFSSFNDSPHQEHLSDRITEDLTTDLSRFNNMRVVSRTTSVTYRNKPIDVRQIGRELGVRYLVEGSVQRFLDRVRVNVHLIDAQADAHLWAGRFDRDPAEWMA